MVDEVVKALTAWAEASRKLGIARKNYVGETFQDENTELIQEVIKSKESFDTKFLNFVDLLVAGG